MALRDVRFCFDNERKLLKCYPKWHPKTFENGGQDVPKRPPKNRSPSLLVGLGRQEAPRGPKRPPRRPKRPPRGRQDGPRWPKTPPRRPKMAQDGFQNGVKVGRKSPLKYSIVLAGPLKSSKVQLELIFRRILVIF